MQLDRRKFLKFLVIGSGAAVIGKLAGPYVWSKLKDQGGFEVGEDFGNDFKVVKKKNQLIFFNKKGSRIFSLNQDGEMEIGD